MVVSVWWYCRLLTSSFSPSVQYKDQVPKPPVSAYLLFHKAKGPKLKEKHPELSTTEMAVKLGKKWRSMEAEKRDKYKQQYIALKAVYEAEMMQFYEEHPDVRPASAPKYALLYHQNCSTKSPHHTSPPPTTTTKIVLWLAIPSLLPVSRYQRRGG